MVEYLKAYAEETYTHREFEEKRKLYGCRTPLHQGEPAVPGNLCPGQARMIPNFWMPNKEWEGCDVTDPSARVPSNYGESGR